MTVGFNFTELTESDMRTFSKEIKVEFMKKKKRITHGGILLMTTISRIGYLLSSRRLSVSLFFKSLGIAVIVPSNVTSVDQVTVRVSLSQLNFA